MERVSIQEFMVPLEPFYSRENECDYLVILSIIELLFRTPATGHPQGVSLHLMCVWQMSCRFLL